jgi:predicted transcriptional regulator
METKLIELTTGIVASFVEKNNLAANDLPGLIKSVHSALSTLGQPETPVEEIARPTPAQIRKSVTPDHLVSFIDGRRYKTLKRHLTTHGLTLEQYKEKFGLPKDYPSTAPSYSAQRSELAKKLGLGQGGRGAAPAAAKAAKGTNGWSPRKADPAADGRKAP